jgi:hypothetical protein
LKGRGTLFADSNNVHRGVLVPRRFAERACA